jgi:hypothetical protein
MGTPRRLSQFVEQGFAVFERARSGALLASPRRQWNSFVGQPELREMLFSPVMAEIGCSSIPLPQSGRQVRFA